MSKIYVDEIAGIASADTVAIPGHVIQVVSADFPSERTTSSTDGYVNTHITASITPQSTSNSILIIVNTCTSVADPTNNFRFLAIGKNATAISDTRKVIRNDFQNNGNDVNDFTVTYLDSPSTTSSVTYSLMVDSTTATIAIGGRIVNTSANGLSSITLMEIAG